MASQDLLPQVSGTDAGWAGNLPVPLQTNDGDTTFNATTTILPVDDYSFEVDKIDGSAGVITQVEHISSSRRRAGAGTPQTHPYAIIRGTKSFFTVINLPLGNTYLGSTQDITASRPGGGNWVPSDFPGPGVSNTGEVGLRATGTSSWDGRNSYLIFRVTFLRRSGTIVLHVAQWLSAMIATGKYGGYLLGALSPSLLSSIQSDILRVNKRAVYPSTTEELERLCQAWDHQRRTAA